MLLERILHLLLFAHHYWKLADLPQIREIFIDPLSSLSPPCLHGKSPSAPPRLRAIHSLKLPITAEVPSMPSW